MARRKSKKKSKRSKGSGPSGRNNSSPSKPSAANASKPLPFDVSQQSSGPAVEGKAKSAAKASATTAGAGDREQPSNFIPEDVSKRMLRRAGWLAGVPTTLGMSAFFVNYYLLVNHIFELPPWFTYAETLALFGMGFVGLTYGVLSASWEPEREGGLVGLSEFQFNVKVLFQQWREYGQQKRQQQAED
ncbi:MAG: PAM68 family protein [Cyanobacteria bacterium P01_E01_bin.34]